MGRHRKWPVDGSVIKDSALGTKEPSDAALERIGLTKSICMSCNARNAPNADACRKCGSNELRDKKSDFADA